jgi:hypothetical protein
MEFYESGGFRLPISSLKLFLDMQRTLGRIPFPQATYRKAYQH